jgi:chorismate mutase
MKSVRAFRGATQLLADDAMEMREAVIELIGELLAANELVENDLISIMLTATPDLKCEFPAVGVRSMGFSDVPLLCAQEIDVDGALPKTVRILIHAQSSRSKKEATHKYLRGASVLRPDLSAKNITGSERK